MVHLNFNPKTDIEKLAVLVLADQPPKQTELLKTWLNDARLPILKKYLHEWIEQCSGGALVSTETHHEAYAEIQKENGVPAYAGGGTIGNVKDWWESLDMGLLPETVQVFIKEQLMDPPANFNMEDPTFLETKEMIENYLASKRPVIEAIVEEPEAVVERTTFLKPEMSHHVEEAEAEMSHHNVEEEAELSHKEAAEEVIDKEVDVLRENLQDTIKAAKEAQKIFKSVIYIFKNLNGEYYFGNSPDAGEDMVMELPYESENESDDLKVLRDELESLEPALQYLSGNDKKEVKEKIDSIKQALELLGGEMETGGGIISNQTVVAFLKSLEKSKIANKGAHKNKQYIDTVKSIVSMSEKEFADFDKKENKDSARIIYFEFKDWIETYSPEKKSHGGSVAHDQREMDRIALSKLSEYSIKLFNIINDKVPAWVLSKISKTELVVASVKHALEAQHPDLFKSGGELSTGGYAKMQLKHIHKYTDSLIHNFDKIKLEAWASSNLFMVADYLDSVYHFLDYEKKPKLATGGETSYDKIKVGDKFTINQMREFLDNKFADSFQFEVWPLKKGTRCEPERDDYKGKKIKYKGLEDSDLSGKLRFPQYRPAHEINYEINQGGENTWFYFLLEDEKNDGFVGHFGFKDDGDVSPEWITGFIAFLQEYYGLPFNVEHSVYSKGGGLEKFIIFNATDGITAWYESFSKAAAEKWIEETRERFKKGQGYYSNNRGQRMDPDDVEYVLIPEKDFAKQVSKYLNK